MPDMMSASTTLPPTLLVPSAGYGPPVSSGITAQLDAEVAVVAVPEVVGVVVVVVVATVAAVVVLVAGVAVVPLLSSEPPQPNTGSVAAPAISQRKERRRLAGAFSMMFRSASRA
jgi:hypothetical protein